MTSNDELYNKILNALKQQTDELKTDIRNLEVKITKQAEFTEKKLNQIENVQNKIINDILQLERTARKNNIVIFGLQAEDDLLNTVLKTLNTLLKLNLCEGDINNIYKINKKKDSPIKIEFISYLKKKLIFERLSELKGKNIFINNDLCKEDQEENKILRGHLKEAKQKGYKVIIKNRKLIINNETYSVKQLEEENLEVTPNIIENDKNRNNNSAPSTPTPILRNKLIEKEFEEIYVNNTPDNKENKKETPQIIKQKVIEKTQTKKATRSNSSTSVDARSLIKTK